MNKLAKLERDHDYFVAGQTIGFSEGKRRFIRYCLETGYNYLTLVNENGPEPFDYLNYAKQDILTGDVHGAINSINNAKRAVHLTIDALLDLWGLKHAYAKEHFPIKLNVLRNLEAFPVSFLNNLNHERNLLEHDYKSADPDKATDFIEVTEMFLMLAYPYLRHISARAIVGLEKDERCLEWTIESKKNSIAVYEIINQRFVETELGKVYINVETRSEKNYSN
jgi:hypothetical protein